MDERVSESGRRMNRSAALGSLLTLAVSAVLVAAAPASATEFHPFTPKGNSAAFEEKVTEEFPGAQFPPKEGVMCSEGEHSLNGPTSYCFGEFTTGSVWNLVEAAVTLNLVSGGGITVKPYSHTSWRRRWKRCGLRREVPGKLLSNDNCGLGQPEQPHAETDGDFIAFEVLPRIRSHKPLRYVSRSLIYSDACPSLSRYRASKKNGVYTFTNALGDSLRYRP